MNSLFKTGRWLVLLLLMVAPAVCQSPESTPGAVAAPARLELSRPVRPWEFLDAVGPRAGLLGSEDGTFEAWVYPLKILRDFRLIFHFHNRAIPAAVFARTVTVRPESSSILYAGDAFSVTETFFVPRNQSGVVIRLEVESHEPLQIEAAFEPDFQLIWPASLGGTYSSWDDKLHAFRFGHEQKKFFAQAGSPQASKSQEGFVANYTSSTTSAFVLPPISTGEQSSVIAIAASVESQTQADATYQALLQQSDAWEADAAAYYRGYLQKTVRLTLPDAKLQQSYDWSLLSMAQGMVTNPYLGTGLIAGYRTSGATQRPGFAWFFGRDSLWTVLALDSAGDFSNARIALDFISKYQRADGKIEHEISQSATLVPWFTDFPYAYASADATPLYIIAMRDYAVQSGDADFAKQKWESIWKAYQFLHSTWDANGMPQNINVGHGWVEGGPLLPVKIELYQSGLGTEALRALAELARLTGQPKIAGELEQTFTRQQSRLNQLFWSPEKHILAFALDNSGRRVDTPSVLGTVPMWFDLLEEKHSNQMIDVLSDYDHAADWGMRIISSQDPRYDPSGYHYGSVWPLFTGWASVGEYKNHRATPAYANLQANAQLALAGSLGHVAEVLSGDNYVGLSTNSPHQIWSSAMVVSPLLRGFMGLEISAPERRVTFAPHVPASWRQFSITNVHVGAAVLDLAYQKLPDGISMQVQRRGTGQVELIFSPALSPVTKIGAVEINTRPATFQDEGHPADHHARMRIPLPSGETTIAIHLRNSFGLENPVALPALGAQSRNLKITSEDWNEGKNKLTLQLSGIGGETYVLEIYGDAKISAEGAELVETAGAKRLRVTFPAGEGYVKKTVTLAFMR